MEGNDEIWVYEDPTADKLPRTEEAAATPAGPRHSPSTRPTTGSR